MFSNITNHDLKRIKKALPDFKKIIDYDELFIEKQIYQIRAISVFDHWLTAEEADKEIFIDDNEKELLNRRNKFKNFIETLSTKTDLYTWKYKKHNRLHIQKPSNTKDVLRKCDFENLYSLLFSLSICVLLISSLLSFTIYNGLQQRPLSVKIFIIFKSILKDIEV